MNMPTQLLRTHHVSPTINILFHTVHTSNKHNSPICFGYMREQVSPCSGWPLGAPGWSFSTSSKKDYFIVVAISFSSKVSSGTLFFSTTNIHQFNPSVWKYQSPLFSWGFTWSLLSTDIKSCCFRLLWETMLVVFYIYTYICIYIYIHKYIYIYTLTN